MSLSPTDPLYPIRHSLAHLLAAAVIELYPDAKPTIGPPTEHGFYYDFDFGDTNIGDQELRKIQKRMKKLLPTWTTFERKVLSSDEATQHFADNPYKLELIQDIISKGEEITVYTSGNFTDLCRGGHVDTMKEQVTADMFQLDSIAGAYWRGDENNIMLTRIYGLAFASQEDLETHLDMIKEAKKRDHRKLGKELDLFVFSPLIGSGMPMFTPKGNLVRNTIIDYSRELNAELGFEEISSPNMNKAELFKTSGHYDKYKDDMLQVHSHYDKQEFFLKPMNCPQHTQMYARRPWSYRDLPQRYSDFSRLYRDERPGELSGLTRLRCFCQDDGHSFCRIDQVHSELDRILSAIQKALKTYSLDYYMRLSLRDPASPEKYLGDDQVWSQSESQLRSLLEERGITHVAEEGEAAFYGPKIDIMAKDSLGREWQISTIQLDFSMPSRFELKYTDENGEPQTPVMIHRALIGSPDRFMGILIEHFAGKFPVWLSPIQVAVLPISGDKHGEYAQTVTDKLSNAGIRAQYHGASESLGKRIRNAKNMRIPYLVIIGDQEMQSQTITVETRTDEKLEGASVQDFTTRVQDEIYNRTLN